MIFSGIRVLQLAVYYMYTDRYLQHFNSSIAAVKVVKLIFSPGEKNELELGMLDMHCISGVKHRSLPLVYHTHEASSGALVHCVVSNASSELRILYRLRSIGICIYS